MNCKTCSNEISADDLSADFGYCGDCRQTYRAYPYVWRVKTRHPDRKGERCNVLIRGKLNNCLVEFTDGLKIVTSRNYVRKAGHGAANS